MPQYFNYESASMRVCLDVVSDEHIAGRVVSQRLTEPMPFNGLDSFVLQIESLMDAQKFPQAFQHMRSFVPDTAPEVPAASEASQMMSAEEVAAAQGAVMTFTVYISTRLNSSWQGFVDWLDGSPREKFHSELELARMVFSHAGNPPAQN